ncbi:EAL domain-containing protein (putative c-di-GMP-specific phosphodiesterase class I) [Arthrobacter sp. GAS37]|uniref:EAL domain-containing protein n=1 Tax=Arthrobacter sp. GAS37 TaxID=3156261 RepID=UPI003834C0B6
MCQGEHGSNAHAEEEYSGFAKEIGAVLAAEGIETEAELSAVAELGMTAGQGYLLGRPSVRPEEWALWDEAFQHRRRPKTSTNPGPNGTPVP